MKSMFATALSLLVLTAAVPAQAGVRTSIYGWAATAKVPEDPSQCPGCVKEFSRTVTRSENTNTLKVYAMADYGVLKGSATASGSGQGADAHGGVEALFMDHFQIDAPGLTGQKGYFTAQVTMPFATSILNPTGLIGGELSMALALNPYNNVSEGYSVFVRSGVALDSLILAKHNDTEVSVDAPMIMKVPFFYGFPIGIQGYLTADVTGQLGRNGGAFSVVMDGAHSLYWGGISSVTDSAGNAVASYTLASDSGTDWTRNFAPPPVPEPTTALLMYGGLGLLACAAVVRRLRSEMPNQRPDAGY